MGTVISICSCGGREEKATDADISDLLLSKALPEAPVGGNLTETTKEPTKTPESRRQAKRTGGVLKKMGKICGRHNLGDKVQEESLKPQAPKPQAFPRDLDEPEGEPGSPPAVEQAGACKSGERQDLNGKWLLVDFEGDLEKLCIECGMGWIKRTAAQAVNYGKGSVQLHITQDGDKVSVEKKLTTGFWVTQQGTVGCLEEGVDDLSSLQATMEYDATGALTFECMIVANGYRFTLRRIRHSPKELHELVTDPNGLVIKQVYTLMDD